MDLYQEITDRIIAEMEKGVIPWLKPWIGNNQAVSHATGKPYSLLNQFLLGEPGEYLSFKQCQREGGTVKKGTKARMVVFWKMLERDMTDSAGNPVLDKDGNHKKSTIPYLQYSNVFHIRDCDGIKAKYDLGTGARANNDPIAEAQHVVADYVSRSGVHFFTKEQNEAYYSPSTDTVVIPLLSQFRSSADYYATAFHELTHSTGHPSRLNRIEKRAAFGNEEYSKEELVAEIGSAALISHVGIETPDTFRNSAAYVQSWLKALQNDKRLIVSASGKAEKAVNLILGSEVI